MLLSSAHDDNIADNITEVYTNAAELGIGR